MQNSLLIPLSVEELEAKITSAVAAGVALVLREVTHTTATQLLTRMQLAEQLQVSPHHISRLAQRGMPAVGIGTNRRFRLAEIEAWLQAQQRRKTPPRA